MSYRRRSKGLPDRPCGPTQRMGSGGRDHRRPRLPARPSLFPAPPSLPAWKAGKVTTHWPQAASSRPLASCPPRRGLTGPLQPQRPHWNAQSTGAGGFRLGPFASHTRQGKGQGAKGGRSADASWRRPRAHVLPRVRAATRQPKQTERGQGCAVEKLQGNAQDGVCRPFQAVKNSHSLSQCFWLASGQQPASSSLASIPSPPPPRPSTALPVRFWCHCDSSSCSAADQPACREAPTPLTKEQSRDGPASQAGEQPAKKREQAGPEHRTSGQALQLARRCGRDPILCRLRCNGIPSVPVSGVSPHWNSPGHKPGWAPFVRSSSPFWLLDHNPSSIRFVGSALFSE